MPTTIPTVTSSTRPGSPSAGDAYFETDTNNYIIYDGANWRGYVSDGVFLPWTANTYSLDFDGTNDYLGIGSNSKLEFTSSFSLSAWVKPDLNKTQYVIDTATSGASGDGYMLRCNSNGTVRFWSYSTNGLLDSTATVSTSSWNHLVAVKNGSTLILYINAGTPATRTDSSFNTSNTANLRIGSSSLLGGYFNGLIDEVSMYNYALTGSDVSSIYSSGSPDDLTSFTPVAHWRMGDNDGVAGSTVTDVSSSGGADATVNGAIFSTTVA
jgi:hypothetical protein